MHVTAGIPIAQQPMTERPLFDKMHDIGKYAFSHCSLQMTSSNVCQFPANGFLNIAGDGPRSWHQNVKHTCLHLAVSLKWPGDVLRGRSADLMCELVFVRLKVGSPTSEIRKGVFNSNVKRQLLVTWDVQMMLQHLLIVQAVGCALRRRSECRLTFVPGGGGGSTPTALCCCKIWPMRSPLLLPTCRPVCLPPR